MLSFPPSTYQLMLEGLLIQLPAMLILSLILDFVLIAGVLRSIVVVNLSQNLVILLSMLHVRGQCCVMNENTIVLVK